MSAVPCLSQSTIATDGKWEGWCWYPDRPEERAVVEVFVGDRSIRAVRAARLRTDVRDLGMGDGYCGFQLPLPAKEHLPEYAVVEVRERRFGRVIGRVVLGEDGTRATTESRLRSAAAHLDGADAALSHLSTRLPMRSAPLEELGAMLSHLSRRPQPSMDSSHWGVFAVCQQNMAVVPDTELGWSAHPHVSLVVRPTGGGVSLDVLTLAGAIRDAARALSRMGAEIILLDDGALPLAKLLPCRLRHLRLVRSPRGSPPGVGLNAAALTARGTWLAFARPAAVGTAQLAEAVEAAADGTLYIATTGADPGALPRLHPLQSLVARQVFHEMGGFDPRMDEPDIWTDLLEKALSIEQRIVRWKPARDAGRVS